MAENLITKDLQKLDPGSEIVQLYELEYSAGSFIYFMSGLDDDLTTIQMRDYSNNSQINTYTAIPAQVKGIEYKNDGAIARPTVTIANATTAFSAAIGTINYQTFLGLKFIRRTTLKKYLYGESGDASPPVEFSRDVYTIDRIKSRTKQSITIECVAPFDLENIMIPARNVLPDRCPFIYQGAGDHVPEYKRAQSGCTWHLEGSKTFGIAGEANGTTYTNIYVNTDDEYIIPSNTSFTAYSSGAVTADSYYSTTSTLTKYHANGTTSSATVTNYWQAIANQSAPGTPSDTNSNFNRVRVYTTYSHGTEYFAYSDDRHNDYVKFTDNVSSSATYNKTILWKVKAASVSVAPTASEYWERGDGCSKRTEGCKKRFGWTPINSGTATSTGKAKTNTQATLPFGGFPAAKAFS